MGLQSGVATLEPEQPGMQNGMVSQVPGMLGGDQQ